MSKYHTRIKKTVKQYPGKEPFDRYDVEYRHKYWPFWTTYDYWYGAANAEKSYDEMQNYLRSLNGPKVVETNIVKQEKAN